MAATWSGEPRGWSEGQGARCCSSPAGNLAGLDITLLWLCAMSFWYQTNAEMDALYSCTIFMHYMHALYACTLDNYELRRVR